MLDSSTILFPTEPGYNRFKPSSEGSVNLSYMISVAEIFKVHMDLIFPLSNVMNIILGVRRRLQSPRKLHGFL